MMITLFLYTIVYSDEHFLKVCNRLYDGGSKLLKMQDFSLEPQFERLYRPKIAIENIFKQLFYFLRYKTRFHKQNLTNCLNVGLTENFK